MPEGRVRLSVLELKKLMNWISKLEDKNYSVVITTTQTGIGEAIKATIETEDNSGVWIDITDYESW